MEQFDAKQQLPGLLDWMRAQMKACGGKTAVIGISGGKDSSTVAALSRGGLWPRERRRRADARRRPAGHRLLQRPGGTPWTSATTPFNIHGGTQGLLDEMEPPRHRGRAARRR